jgi:hypothetical protein
MPDLKLIALDAEDLAVLSAHLQDAVVRVADMTFRKGEKRFAALLNRFDWEKAIDEPGRKTFERRRAGLRFERVLKAKVSGIDLKDSKAVLSLLAIAFEPKDEPEGFVTLHFSGGPAIRLHVECIEAELKDLGAAWATRQKPEHGDGTGETKS